MTTPLTPEALRAAAAERGISTDDIDAASDALTRKAATALIPAAQRASALRIAGSTARQLLGDIDSAEIAAEALVLRGESLVSASLPRYPLDLLAAAERIAALIRDLNVGEAARMLAWFIDATERLGLPADLRGSDPDNYPTWLANDGADLNAAQSLKQRQSDDAERVAAANAPTRANVAWTDLTLLEQERAGAGRKPGDIVKVGSGRYVQVPEELEALLGDIEGLDAEIGEIPGLSAA